MKYFLHDTNAFQDEKITELYMAFGYEGLGLFYTLLERLAEREKPVKTDILKRQLGVGKKLEKVWKFLEEIELISTKNGETFNKKMLEYVETFDKKRGNTKKRVSQFRENQDNTEIVTRYNRVRNTSNSNRSESIMEDKEKIEDKSSINPLPSVEVKTPEPQAPIVEVPQNPPEKPIPSKKQRLGGEHLFRNSPYSDLDLFVGAFEEKYQIYDLPFYYEKVKNWSDSKNATKVDWIATARNFMLGDVDKGIERLRPDLKRNGSQQQPKQYNGNRQDQRPTDAEFGATIDALIDAKYNR